MPADIYTVLGKSYFKDIVGIILSVATCNKYYTVPGFKELALLDSTKLGSLRQLLSWGHCI